MAVVHAPAVQWLPMQHACNLPILWSLPQPLFFDYSFHSFVATLFPNAWYCDLEKQGILVLVNTINICTGGNIIST
uniref:Uncharacterized protein n=1 Tax=Setaria italica TaxID=4555 RepID=K3XNY2_SETIT